MGQVAGRIVAEARHVDPVRCGVDRDVQSGSAPASYILLQQVAKWVVNKRLVARDCGQPVCPTGLYASKHLHSLLPNSVDSHAFPRGKIQRENKLRARAATATPNRTRGVIPDRQRKVSGNSLCIN